MLKLVIVGTVMAAAAAFEHPINEDIVKHIRENTSRWTAHEPSENPLRHWTKEDIKARLGTIIGGPVEGIPEPIPSNADVPTKFDSRKQWEDCIHPIRDQAQCGSCWAFGATEALSDRICIASGGKTDVILSPQDLVSCDKWDMGCNGGILSWAWSYLTNTGAVSDECVPYASETGKAPTCAKKCVDSTQEFKKYKCTKGSVVQATGIDTIKAEIYANGPMETGFTVYEDFMNYKSGVYKHETGDQLGGHAVKIVGWGEDYWICANSWGTSWGMDGFFNIAFGDCGIDSSVYACKPSL